MERGPSGRYESTVVGGERVKAFVPRPLPPAPALVLDGALQPALESALLSLGRLDGVSTQLPDPGLFLYAYVRKEAVLSSQIEGTQSSLSDLMLVDLGIAREFTGKRRNRVFAYGAYITALSEGTEPLGKT